MRERPTGAELLWQARDSLLNELLPELPSERRYTALMAAAAMATAARELDEGGAAERRALATLTDSVDHCGADPDALLAELAQTVRQGQHDGDARLHTVLWTLTRQRLRVANPNAMPEEETPG